MIWVGLSGLVSWIYGCDTMVDKRKKKDCNDIARDAFDWKW